MYGGNSKTAGCIIKIKKSSVICNIDSIYSGYHFEMIGGLRMKHYGLVYDDYEQLKDFIEKMK